MDKNSVIYVAGHQGLVGSTLVRALMGAGYERIVTSPHSETDLTDARAVQDFFMRNKPAYVFLAAARVGGIMANSQYPAEFIHTNLAISTNVIHTAYTCGVKKLLYLGSSCIYPKFAPQPMQEEYLLTGELEPTNEWYAIAKIAGIKMCQAYRRQYGFCAISLMPTNLYGPHDNFDLHTSHVLPALIRKLYEACRAGESQVTIWGTGSPRREFLYVDDLVQACLFLMQHYDEEAIINVGTGKEISIRELAELIAETTGFTGKLEYDTSKPDGMPRKRLDVSRLHALGWKAETSLRDGIKKTCDWFCQSF